MDSKLKQVVEAVIAKTDSGALKWDALSDELFQVRVAGRVVQISRGSTRFEDDSIGELVSRTVYVVSVTDQGRVVAEADLTDGGPTVDFALCERLFTAARKSALNADAVLDDLLGALRGKG